MTEEVKLVVDTLRYCEETGARCGACPSGHDERGVPNCHSQSVIADLIESLSETCDQLTDALKTRGFENIEAVFVEMDQVKRERDAAVADMQKTPITLCEACAHYHTGYPCSGGKYIDKINITVACTMFKWRGVREVQ